MKHPPEKGARLLESGTGNLLRKACLCVEAPDRTPLTRHISSLSATMTSPGRHSGPTPKPPSPRAYAASRKLCLLFLFFGTAAVSVVAALGLLRGQGRHTDAALLPLTQSRFTCHGESTDTRQCVFHGVIVQEGAIWLYRKDVPTVVPPVLCSTANQPSFHASLCKVHVITDVQNFVKLLRKTSSTPHFDVGVALHRLNPSNAYHTIYEDMIPAAAMLGLLSNMSVDPALTMHSLRERRWGLFLVDDYGSSPLDKRFWREFLPEIAMVHPSRFAYRVGKMIAGTQASCAHWGHCQPSDRPAGLFSPPEAAVALRRLVFHRNDIEPEEPDLASSRQRRPPRVTLVQRSSTRVIRNLDAVVEKLTSVLGVPPQVVDMAHLSVLEQVTIAHNTDIYVLVHGGALANILWLPPGALVIDIYPHGFFVSHHSGIVHWIRKALEPAVAVGHLPFQLQTAEGQVLESGPLLPGCVCHTFECQIHVFITLAFLTMEVDRFEAHLKEALQLWQGGKYAASVTSAVFQKKQAKEDDERTAAQIGAPSCAT